MSVQNLNHVNIAVPAPLMKKLRDFYVDVIGLADGERPDIGIPGHWLYGGDTPLIHLMEPMREPPAADNGSGAIDHVAFTCTDFDGMTRRLEKAGVEFRKREAPDFGIAQLFLEDPAGIRVELNFEI